MDTFQFSCIEILYRISIYISVQGCQKESRFSSRQKINTKVVNVNMVCMRKKCFLGSRSKV